MGDVDLPSSNVEIQILLASRIVAANIVRAMLYAGTRHKIVMRRSFLADCWMCSAVKLQISMMTLDVNITL